jgi:hypothetical protein
MEKIIIPSIPELRDIFRDILHQELSENFNFLKVDSEKEQLFLDLPGACDLLHIAPQTLYGMTSKGTIPFLKRGKKLIFEKKVLIQWQQKLQKL